MVGAKSAALFALPARQLFKRAFPVGEFHFHHQARLGWNPRLLIPDSWRSVLEGSLESMVFMTISKEALRDVTLPGIG
jgi:hypothetical protein